MSYQKTGVRAMKGVIRGQPCTRVGVSSIRSVSIDAIAELAMDLGLATRVRAPCGLCPAFNNLVECGEASIAYGPCGFNGARNFMVWVADEYVPLLAMRSEVQDQGGAHPDQT